MIWLLILAVSSSIGLLLAKVIGTRLPLRILIVLSVINLALISALAFILLIPTHFEAQVYAVAEIAAIFVIAVQCILPSTIFFWLVRFMKKREIA